jgi:cbb3-type cytochrome oxidase cytochrome c subunit
MDDIRNAVADRDTQAAQISASLSKEGYTGMQDKELVALIAYLQRLGKGPVQSSIAEQP